MSITKETFDAKSLNSWLLCSACGTQFPTSDRSQLDRCFICEDPRQYLPPTGQAFTTLSQLSRGASPPRNEFIAYEPDPRHITSIHTTPKLGIGQRAILVTTPQGKNILWDCVALLDDETVEYINRRGGLQAIVISHPHYYTTHVHWARAFGCPVYIAAEDAGWTTMKSSHQVLLTDQVTELLDGAVKVIKTGGHFPGSLVLLHGERLFIADTVMTTPAGLGKRSLQVVEAGESDSNRGPGQNSFAFMWSIPNMIPLSADEMMGIWRALKPLQFTATMGAFMGMDIEDEGVKGRVLDSMRIQCTRMGWAEHPLMKESL